MITHYRTVCSWDDTEELEKDVNDLIAQGWQPLGGLTVAINDFYSEDHTGGSKENYRIIFAQAMVKRATAATIP